MPSKEALPFRPMPQEPRSASFVPDFNPMAEFSDILQEEQQLPVLADGSVNFGGGAFGPSTEDVRHADTLFHEIVGMGSAVVNEASPVGDVLNFSRQADGAWAYQRPQQNKRLPNFIAVPAAAAMAFVFAACGTGINTPTGESQPSTPKLPAPEATYRVSIPIMGKDAQLPPPTETATPAKPNPTITPRPSGGSEKGSFKDPRLNELQDRIARGLANEAEIAEFNKGAAVEQAAPTSTVAPAETKKDQPCAILPPEFCSQVTRKPVVIDGVEYTYIVFHNDSKDKVPVFAAADGQFLNKIKESGAPFSGFSVQLVLPLSDGGYVVSGDLEIDKLGQTSNPKKSSTIASVIPGGTVYMTKTKRSPNGPVVDEDVLGELFPEAYKNSPLALYDGPTNTTVVNYYGFVSASVGHLDSDPTPSSR